MLRLAFVALTVGLADSVNPSTVGPALYLATVPNGAVRVAQFTGGVFCVTLAGGLVLTLGPGSFLLGLIPRPQGTARHVIQLVAGVLLLIAALGLWIGRHRLARRKLPMSGGKGSSAIVAGASIAALELPTALPYFAVAIAIVASSASVPAKIGVLVIYNVAAVLPLLAIVLVLLTAGERADRWLQRGGAWLQRRWPVVLAGLLLLVGSVLTVLGGAGVLKS